jgi:hypothetical protein
LRRTSKFGQEPGKSLNLHQFHDIQGGNLIVAPDLRQTLAKVDQSETDMQDP